MLGTGGAMVSKIDTGNQNSPASWEFSLSIYNLGNQDCIL